MKIAIKENSIFIERDWQEHFKDDYISGYDNDNNPIISPKIDLTEEPYNFIIVEVPDAYAIDCIYADFKNNVFNLAKYTERKRMANELKYKDVVIAKIRVKYSLDDEIAIHRQREIKPQEWAEYNAYCEDCKIKARETIE